MSPLQSYASPPAHPFSFCILWKKVIMCSPHVRNAVISTSLRAEELNYFKLFCPGDLSSQLHLFIYSIMYVYQYESYIFILHFDLESNTTLFCWSNCFSSSHWQLLKLAPVSLWYAQIFMCSTYYFVTTLLLRSLWC